MKDIAMIIAAVFGFGLALEFVGWLMQLSVGSLKIKYKDFLTYYVVNPDRFRLDDVLRANIDGERVYFKFNFLDYMRYKIFLRNRTKVSERQRNNEAMSKFLQAVMDDVQVKREQAMMEQEMALKELMNHSKDNDTQQGGML